MSASQKIKWIIAAGIGAFVLGQASPVLAFWLFAGAVFVILKIPKSISGVWQEAASVLGMRFEQDTLGRMSISGKQKGMNVSISLVQFGGKGGMTEYKVLFANGVFGFRFMIDRSANAGEAFQKTVPNVSLYESSDVLFSSVGSVYTDNIEAMGRYLDDSRRALIVSLFEDWYDVRITDGGLRVRVSDGVRDRKEMFETVDALVRMADLLDNHLPEIQNNPKVPEISLPPIQAPCLKIPSVNTNHLKIHSKQADVDVPTDPALEAEVLTPAKLPIESTLNSPVISAVPEQEPQTLDALCKAVFIGGAAAGKAEKILTAELGRSFVFTGKIESTQSSYLMGKGSVPTLILTVCEIPNRFGGNDKIKATVYLPPDSTEAKSWVGKTVHITGSLLRGEIFLRNLHVQADHVAVVSPRTE